MSLKPHWWAASVSGLVVYLFSASVIAEEAAAPISVSDAITGGETALSFRYRYEFVDQESFDEDANASTLRMRLNYETADYRGWNGFVEFDYVFELWPKDFNSGSGTSGPNRNQYPVVADPDGPDLNQFYLQYAAGDDWKTRLGRQRILLDDQRFVGGVGWRQNEQDVTIRRPSLSICFDDTSIFYSYVVNVNRIFGSSVPAGTHKQNTHLLNAKVDLVDNFKVIGYAYLIDNDDSPAFSTDTFGIRAEAGFDVGGGKVSVLGEVATQSDAANNPANFSANYYRLQAIWKGGVLMAGLGYEVLGSDNGQGFRTPLATLHAFNGWADQFLSTPGDGLEDIYIKLGATLGKWSLEGRYHDFSAEASSENYASENRPAGKAPIRQALQLAVESGIFRQQERQLRRCDEDLGHAVCELLDLARC